MQVNCQLPRRTHGNIWGNWLREKYCRIGTKLILILKPIKLPENPNLLLRYNEKVGEAPVWVSALQSTVDVLGQNSAFWLVIECWLSKKHRIPPTGVELTMRTLKQGCLASLVDNFLPERILWYGTDGSSTKYPVTARRRYECWLLRLEAVKSWLESTGRVDMRSFLSQYLECGCLQEYFQMSTGRNVYSSYHVYAEEDARNTPGYRLMALMTCSNSRPHQMKQCL